MSFPLRCIDKQALGYITHEASTLSRVRFPVRQFAYPLLLSLNIGCWLCLLLPRSICMLILWGYYCTANSTVGASQLIWPLKYVVTCRSVRKSATTTICQHNSYNMIWYRCPIPSSCNNRLI